MELFNCQTTGFLKKGLITNEASKHIGELINMDIGIVIEDK